jgi:hypothetical protein
MATAQHIKRGVTSTPEAVFAELVRAKEERARRIEAIIQARERAFEDEWAPARAVDSWAAWPKERERLVVV